MLAVGIDIGSQNFALAMVEEFDGKLTVIKAETVKITKKGSINLVYVQKVVKRHLLTFIDEYEIQFVAIERQPWTFVKNPKIAYITALNIAIEAISITLCTQMLLKPILSVNPLHWRKTALLKRKETKSLENYKAKYDLYKSKNIYVFKDSLTDVHQHDAFFVAIAAYQS